MTTTTVERKTFIKAAQHTHYAISAELNLSPISSRLRANYHKNMNTICRFYSAIWVKRSKKNGSSTYQNTQNNYIGAVVASLAAFPLPNNNSNARRWRRRRHCQPSSPYWFPSSVVATVSENGKSLLRQAKLIESKRWWRFHRALPRGSTWICFCLPIVKLSLSRDLHNYIINDARIIYAHQSQRIFLAQKARFAKLFFTGWLTCGRPRKTSSKKREISTDRQN